MTRKAWDLTARLFPSGINLCRDFYHSPSSCSPHPHQKKTTKTKKQKKQKNSLLLIVFRCVVPMHWSHVSCSAQTSTQLIIASPQLRESQWKRRLSTLCFFSEPPGCSPSPRIDVLCSALGTLWLPTVLLLKTPNSSDFVNIPQYLLKPSQYLRNGFGGNNLYTHIGLKKIFDGT